MPITESKIKNGLLTLTIGAGTPQEFGTQATNVRIEPSYDEEGDSVEVVSGDTLSPETVESHELVITAIQDFADPAGFMAYLWANSLEEAAFVWDTGPAGAGVRFTGNVQLRKPPTGGDVNTRLTTEFTLPCIGPVTGPTEIAA